MIQRSSPAKGLICEHCQEAIFRDIDCIGHHVKELTSQNVNDINFSLNPKNILLVHHRCHNAIHERFGQGIMQRVYIVYCAHLSGKTSYVRASKGHKDIVLDLDELYQAITLLPAYNKPTELASNVFHLRDSILDQIKTITGKWSQAWIIGGYPLQTERQRLVSVLGAELIYVEATEDKCLSRLFNDTDKLPSKRSGRNISTIGSLHFGRTPPRSRCEDNQLGTGQGTSNARNLKISNFYQSPGKNSGIELKTSNFLKRCSKKR